jgi:hypothetical protein
MVLKRRETALKHWSSAASVLTNLRLGKRFLTLGYGMVYSIALNSLGICPGAEMVGLIIEFLSDL